MFTTAVIISAGRGSRMSPITDYIPKALVKVNGVPLIEHVITFLRRNSIREIYCTYGYLGEQLVNHLHRQVSGFINTSYEDNSYFLGNSLVKNEEEPIVVCPCDVILDLNLRQVYEDYVKLDMPPICIVPINATENADYLHVKDGRLVTKIDRDNPSELCASGVQIIRPKYILDSVGKIKSNFYDLWNELIMLQSLYVTKTMPKVWKSYDDIKSLQ